MKLPEEQKQEIINGMLEMLDPDAQEAVEEIDKCSGRDLINLHGITKDINGAQILPSVIYNYSITKYRKLNHKRRLGQMIADAANMNEMTEALGVYLSKYALSKEAVVATIPVHLSLQNIKQNEN